MAHNDLEMKNVKPVSEWTDQDIEQEIARLQAAIERLIKRRKLWHDCGFQSHLYRNSCEPAEEPVITCFYFEGGLDYITDGPLSDEFSELLNRLGYWYEQDDNVTLYIYADDDDVAGRFFEYFHWQWVCSLLIEDTADVYQEIYEHFASRPDDLHRLPWRKFEILLFRIFQNQGFTAFLGPGSGDGGVDLRLWQTNPLGDILTVVQAKRYAPNNRIDPVPVQALYGVGKVEGAGRSLFVTTSSYTPAAHRFASRVADEMVLAEKRDIVAWCDKAKDGVIKDKSSLVSKNAVARLVAHLASKPDARIVHATWGYNMTNNSYAVVIKETEHAALLMNIGNRKVSDDGYGQRGFEVPLLDQSAMIHFHEAGVRRATRFRSVDGVVSYWDGCKYYAPWSGRPDRFDYMD